MSRPVGDASALVSLGIVASNEPDPLSVCLTDYDVVVQTAVIDGLQETVSYEDAHGRAAAAVLERTEALETRSVRLDSGFPLGENAALTLANDTDAALLLCDEFTHLGLIRASLADTRLVTTPTLLSVLVRTERLSVDEARTLLDAISETRTRASNSYVQRARSVLEQPDCRGLLSWRAVSRRGRPLPPVCVAGNPVPWFHLSGRASLEHLSAGYPYERACPSGSSS
jgi:hypothetical protein